MTGGATRLFQPQVLGVDGFEDRFPSTVIPAGNLFSDVDREVSEFLNAGVARELPAGPEGLMAYRLSPSGVVTFEPAGTSPGVMQAFMVAMAERLPTAALSGPLQPAHLDPAIGLTLWANQSAGLSVGAEGLWRQIVTAGELSPVEMLCTPRLYGNKLRLTNFIGAVVEAVIPKGVPVLDLMAGTGVMARALSSRRPVAINDGNPYAALFSRSQGEVLSVSPATLMAQLQVPFEDNRQALTDRLSAALEREAAFLHGDVNIEAQHAYLNFVAERVLRISTGREGLYCLATERYANVYFGIAQTVEIDSLRAAIDVVAPHYGVLRDLLMTALLLAVSTCASGPHFAQPNQPNSKRAMQTLIERRARSLVWEFDLALTRLGARPAPAHPFVSVGHFDWREALDLFAARHVGQAAVYVDPPYSKLQYSRYYHVLNVLLEYDYPEVSGRGRYPPRSARFSSRFEYQQGAARKEFEALFAAVARYGFNLLVSYGERGFVPTPELALLMGTYYSDVTAFTERVRHHSQGRVLRSGAERVTEYLLVGRGSKQ